MTQMAGSVVLITGGSNGLGHALAAAAARRGARVIICGRDAARLRQAAEATGADFVICDVRNAAERTKLVEHVGSKYGRLNLLINNAGVAHRQNFASRAFDFDLLQEELETNVFAPVHLANASLGLLTASPSAAVVNVSTALAYVPIADVGGYCATKAALHSFSRSLRRQLRGKVRVVEALLPTLDTQMSKNYATTKVAPAVAAARIMNAIGSAREEIRFGQASQLFWMSRVAPNFIFSQLNPLRESGPAAMRRDVGPTRRTLITGGAGGIGFALAKALLAAGDSVVICDRDESALRRAKMAAPNVHTVACDITSMADRARLAAYLEGNLSGVDLLINNAGIQIPMQLDNGAIDMSAVERQFTVNWLAPLRLTHELLPVLKRGGRAELVFVSSALAYAPIAANPIYCATKAAVHSMAQSVRHSLRPEGISVLEVLPGLVDTPFAADVQGGKESPDALADKIVRALRECKPELRSGWGVVMHVMNRVAPNAIFDEINKPRAPTSRAG